MDAYVKTRKHKEKKLKIYSNITSYSDNEGHTINYTITYAEKSIVFTNDKIANVTKFRLTYTLLEDQEVNTKFEMSRDGENFTTYIEGKSKKS